MTTITISNLPLLPSISSDTFSVPVEDAGVTSRITGLALKNYISTLPSISATNGVISNNFSVGSLSVATTANIIGTLNAVAITAGPAAFSSISGSSLSISSTGSFTSNVSAANFNATQGVYSSTLTGTLLTAAQPNITSVGTLTGLSVSGTINANISGSAGNVTYPSQPAITSIGTLSSLSVIGTTTTGSLNAGSISTSSLSLTTITAVTVNGTNIGGTLVTAAQPNVTSIGTLTGLTTSGTITSTVATGSSPFSVASITKVTNLNADLVDDMHATSAATASTIVARDNSGAITGTNFIGPGTGLTGTASALSIGGTAATAINATNATQAVNATNAINATNATSASTATNIGGGAAGSIPYQTNTGATSFIAGGTAGYILTSNGAAVSPTWQALPNNGVGVNQTWQSVTRSPGTNYVNSTGKPIILSVLYYTNGAGGSYIYGTIGGVNIYMGAGYAGGGSYPFVGQLFVPVGATYSFNQSIAAGSPVYSSAVELR